MDGVEGRVQLQIFSEVGKDSQSYEVSHCFTHVQYPTRGRIPVYHVEIQHSLKFLECENHHERLLHMF